MFQLLRISWTLTLEKNAKNSDNVKIMSVRKCTQILHINSLNVFICAKLWAQHGLGTADLKFREGKLRNLEMTTAIVF